MQPSTRTQVHADELGRAVEEIVRGVRVVDVHTHLYPGCCDGLLLRGIDDLLTYHYLVVETLRYGEMEPGRFFALSKREQADEVWRTLFVEHSPITEACRGVLTVLKYFGLDPNVNSLDEMREYFARLSLCDHIDAVFQGSNVDYVVMTNDPFDRLETPYWGPEFAEDSRFRAALRIDPLLNTPGQAMEYLKSQGYAVSTDLSQSTFAELQRFFERVSSQIRPVYFAASLPPSFRWDDQSVRHELLSGAVLPFCRQHGLPLALMIGVNKLSNPQMGLGGDSLGRSCVSTIERMCADNPENRFLVTLLSRENQHELCVAARKFPNLMIFGCWWFLNNPSLIREITAMRLELLGLSFIPQHSDARVLDQLLYKWDHSKQIISQSLAEKYRGLLEAGWTLYDDDIRRDVEQLLSGNAQSIMGIR